MRSHIYNKSTWSAPGTKTSQGNLVRSRKWILHTHTKGNKCLHLASNGQQAPFWAIPIGLVIHSKVAAVRRKVALPLMVVCIWSGFGSYCLKEGRRGGQMSGWRSVLGRPVSSAGCSQPEQSCPALARQALRCLSIKPPCCVRNFHTIQVPWRF